jgi:hypothetical protein
MAASMTMIAIWDIAPFSLVEVTLNKQTVDTSDTSAYYNETSRRYIPEGYHLRPLNKL